MDIGQRAQMESALRWELDSYAEASCACSEFGDDQAVIISYKGVIR